MTAGAEVLAADDERRDRFELAVYAVLLAWFAVRIAYLASTLGGAVPPDEATHVGRVLAFASTPGLPDDGPGTYALGLLSHRPWLYYWLMGRIAPLGLGASDLVFLRLVNGLLGVGTAAIAIAWFRLWCDDRMARVLFAVLVTNTLMFTGLAAAVSYDNLANLLAAAAVYALARFRASGSANALFALVALLAAGCLAKRTMLPFAFLMAVLLLFREHAALRRIPERLATIFRRRRASTLALLALAAVLCALVGSLYGGNLVRYGALRPAFDQVVGDENAMQNRVHARARIIERYRDGELTLAQAEALAREIPHRGDRSDTLVLLRSLDRPDAAMIGPVDYASEWLQTMLRGTVGYLGHRRAFKGRAATVAYVLVFVAAGLLFVRAFRRRQGGGVPADAAFLAAGYASILMWLVNYPTYLEFRNVELAVQGRYLFPVLVPIYGLVAYYLLAPLPTRARPWVATAVSGLYLWGDVPWLASQITERWL